MQNVFAKKSAIAAALAVVVVALTAAAAFAAPVLPPGTTSAPGMSGTCTDCHTYATASTATPTVKKAKPTVVSHPYMAKGKRHSAKSFKVWGYVSPKLPKSTQSTTLTVSVQRYVAHSWVSTDGVTATATVSPKGKFRNKTNYTAKLTLAKTGRYRIRANLVWTDAKGVEHTKRSSYYYIRIYK